MKYGESYQSLAKNIQPFLDISKHQSAYSPSLYPPWWDKTLTVYNKYMDPETNLVTWHRTYLANCSVVNSHKQTITGQVIIKGNSIIARIPQNNNFKPYYEWINLSEDERCNYFTLNKGDIIIIGVVVDDIDEYSGVKSTTMIEKYKKMGLCFTIDEFSDNAGPSRVAPHYYAGGE